MTIIEIIELYLVNFKITWQKMLLLTLISMNEFIYIIQIYISLVQKHSHETEMKFNLMIAETIDFDYSFYELD
jgi:hypothetical protein